MKDAYLVCIDDPPKEERQMLADKLKNEVTSDTMTIRPLHSNPFTIKSYHKFMITTNESDTITLEDEQRRFSFIYCSDEKVKNTAYFNKFYEYLRNTETIRTLYEYFKNMEVPENFDECGHPKSQFHIEKEESNMTVFDCFLKYFTLKHQNDSIVEFSPTEIWTEFQNWKNADEYFSTFNISIQKIYVNLKTAGGSAIGSRKTNSIVIKIYDFDLLKKKYNINQPISAPTPPYVMLSEENEDDDSKIKFYPIQIEGQTFYVENEIDSKIFVGTSPADINSKNPVGFFYNGCHYWNRSFTLYEEPIEPDWLWETTEEEMKEWEEDLGKGWLGDPNVFEKFKQLDVKRIDKTTYRKRTFMKSNVVGIKQTRKCYECMNDFEDFQTIYCCDTQITFCEICYKNESCDKHTTFCEKCYNNFP